MRKGPNVWTSWHQDNSNRVDCWQLLVDGTLALFQIGVITHDDGRTWRLHGERRWRGKLFRSGDELVAAPDDWKWGPFKTWEQIFNYPAFKKLSQEAQLQEWIGSPEGLNPPLEQVPDIGLGVVEWYVPFAGQTGQGIVNLHPNQGTKAWVHGIDIQEEPDPDGVKRLVRGDIVAFEGEPQKWGKKEGAPPKIVKVTKVS